MEKYMDNRILFMIFCIEGLAEKLGLNGSEVYDLLAKRTNILKDYIDKNYEVLHSQGKKYIISDLETRLEEEGVIL